MRWLCRHHFKLVSYLELDVLTIESSPFETKMKSKK